MHRPVSIFIIIVVAIFTQFTTSHAGNVKCGEHEEPSDCANSCVVTCERPELTNCRILPQDCEKGCKCKSGYLRESYAWGSKCIRGEDCGNNLNQHWWPSITRSTTTVTCDENEEASNCANSCIATCEKPSLGECMIHQPDCIKGCKCKRGYVKENRYSGKCVAVKDCPMKCGENEIASDCANVCLVSCERPSTELCSINIMYCEEGCKCRPGYIREFHSKSSRCIASEDCPRPSYY